VEMELRKGDTRAFSVGRGIGDGGKEQRKM
jgi:hypothetical protein